MTIDFPDDNTEVLTVCRSSPRGSHPLAGKSKSVCMCLCVLAFVLRCSHTLMHRFIFIREGNFALYEHLSFCQSVRPLQWRDLGSQQNYLIWLVSSHTDYPLVKLLAMNSIYFIEMSRDGSFAMCTHVLGTMVVPPLVVAYVWDGILLICNWIIYC